jgi:hypothetical protein
VGTYLPRWLTVNALSAAGLVALSLPVCVSLFTTRLPQGHDTVEYLRRQVEFHENISHGILLPRWAPDQSRGNGQPLFLFNPPLIYYLGEAWHLLGFDFVTAMNLACIVIVLASACSMFLLGRLYFGDAGGWLAAAAYLYAPYFIVNLYVRSALAEFAAFPFFALALFGVGSGRLAVAAIGYAGVLFSHPPATMVFTPLLVAFLCFTAWMAKSWAVLRAQICGFLLGLGLGAAVWLPGLAERQYVSFDRLLVGYPYSDHFVYLRQFFYSPWGYGPSIAGPSDGMSFALGGGHLLLAFLACLAGRRTERPLLRFFAGAAIGLCFLMLPASAWLWDHLPLLQYVCLPWRLLGPVSVCLALLVAALGVSFSQLPRWRRTCFCGALVLLIVPNLHHLKPKQLLNVDLALWTPAQLAARGTEARDERVYEPRWMEVMPEYRPQQAVFVSGHGEALPRERNPIRWSGSVQTPTPAVLEMSIIDFPGWRVWMDGQEIPVQRAPQTGLIRFAVPAGRHEVEVRFTRTAPRWIGEGISVLSLVLLLTLIVRGPGPPEPRELSDAEP